MNIHLTWMGVDESLYLVPRILELLLFNAYILLEFKQLWYKVASMGSHSIAATCQMAASAFFDKFLGLLPLCGRIYLVDGEAIQRSLADCESCSKPLNYL